MKRMVSIFSLSVLLFTMNANVLEAKNEGRRALVGISCVAALMILVGHLWWTDRIHFAFEDNPAQDSQQGVTSRYTVTKAVRLGADVYTIEGLTMGTLEVHQNLFSVGASLELKTVNGTLLATGKRSALEIPTIIEFKDAQGNCIGKIIRESLESLGTTTVFSLYDKADRLVATSKRPMSFMTHLSIESPEGRILASVDQDPSLVLGTRWIVKRFDGGDVIDEHLLALMVSFLETK